MVKETKMEEEPKNTRSPIFNTQEDAVAWCIHHNLLPKVKACIVEKCTGIMHLEHDPTYLNKYRYRCYKTSCGKSCGGLDQTLFATPQIPIHEYLLVLYMWLGKSFAYDISENTNVSESSIFRVKKKIYDLIKKENLKDYKKKIGGFETAVQIDETVIIKGKLYRSPSKKKDKIKGATWLVGCVEEDTNELRLEIVPNRKLPAMKAFFKRNIKDKTIVKSDGHRSYPASVESIDGEHIVVNHDKGFKNAEGHTTNRIEGVWGLAKYDIKLRKGIKNTAIPNFLEEFKWRRKHIPRKSKITRIHKRTAFLELVKLFFI